MDQGPEKSEDFSKLQPEKCLFPIASFSSTSKEAKGQAKTLFPCVGSVQQSIKDGEFPCEVESYDVNLTFKFFFVFLFFWYSFLFL